MTSTVPAAWAAEMAVIEVDDRKRWNWPPPRLLNSTDWCAPVKLVPVMVDGEGAAAGGAAGAGAQTADRGRCRDQRVGEAIRKVDKGEVPPEC